jgi:hypothetical protein
MTLSPLFGLAQFFGKENASSWLVDYKKKSLSWMKLLIQIFKNTKYARLEINIT